MKQAIAGVVALAVAVASAAPLPVFAQTASTLQDRPLWEAADAGSVQQPALRNFDSPSSVLWPIKSYGPSAAPAGNGNGGNGADMGESEINSFGCLIGGTVGMGGAIYIGGTNISNLIAGGLVVPQNPAALYVTLFGVVFATFCAVGQADAAHHRRLPPLRRAV